MRKIVKKILDIVKKSMEYKLTTVFWIIATSLLIVGIFIYKDDLRVETSADYLTCELVQQFNNIPIENGKIIQEFTAEQNDLNIFYLWLKNCNSSDSGKILIKIEDFSGKSYYEGQYFLDELGNDGFCLVGGIQNSIKKGKKYELIIEIEEVNSNAVIQAVNEKGISGSILDSMGELSVNGEVLKGTALYMLQTYPSSTISIKAIWMILWILVTVTIVIGIVLESKVVNSIMRGFTGILGVITAYLAIEILQGDVRSIELKYACINCTVIFSVILMLYAIIKRYAWYVMLTVCAIIGIANYYVKQFRGTELQISDIKSFATAMSVAGNYNFDISVQVYTVIIIMFLEIGLLALYWRNEKYNEEKKRNYKLRGGLLACGTVYLIIIYNILVPTEKFNWFNQSAGFVQFGWIYSNMIIQYNSKMLEPQGYSEGSIQEIISSITDVEIGDAVTPQNLIVIMNESLCDLETIGDLQTNRDYMPFIYGLEENTIRGELYVSTFGGNTAITEYEFLTGNTEHFFRNGLIPYTTLCEENEAGLCQILKAQNFHTVAMHPYGPQNWNRNKVYPAMGFDEFLSLEDYQEATYIRNYVSDQSDYEKIIEYVKNDGAEDRLFVFNVTMQNHGGYDVNNGTMETLIEIDNFDNKVAETYLSLVYESDKAFEYLLNFFKEFDEPTMIVMFGDHMPALPDNVYDSIYGANYHELSAEDQNKKYITPYVIWTNYESDFEEKKLISANYLGSYVLECAGLKKSVYNQFLLNLMDEVPAIGYYGFVDKSGHFVSYEESDEQIFSQYRMLQYMRIKDRKSKFYDCFMVQD